jgi:hypothetical protein
MTVSATKKILLGLTIAVLTSAPALAQDFTAAQRAACKDDYNKLCKGTLPGGGRILACLSKQGDGLSAACKKVVAENKK